MQLLLKRLLVLLNTKQRRLSYALLGVMVLAGLIDALGVSSILPFMAVVGNPELIQTNPWLHKIFTTLKFESPIPFSSGWAQRHLYHDRQQRGIAREFVRHPLVCKPPGAEPINAATGQLCPATLRIFSGTQ